MLFHLHQKKKKKVVQLSQQYNFPSPPKDLLCPFAVNLHSYPQPQATTILSITIGLHSLDIPYEWIHTVFDLLHLAYLI